MPRYSEARPGQPAGVRADEAAPRRFPSDATRDPAVPVPVRWEQRPGARRRPAAGSHGTRPPAPSTTLSRTMPAKSRRASGTGTGPAAGDPHAEVTRAEDGPRAVPPGGLPPAEPGARDEAEVTGDTGKPAVLRGHLGAPDPDSAVVSP